MSSRGLMKSMLIIGSANVVTIGIAILRQKAVAVLLGPAGIGLLGIYANLVGSAATVAGLGLGSSGVRQIAAAREDAAVLARVRRVLFCALAVQGVFGSALVWAFRTELAGLFFDDPARTRDVGLVALAVALTLVASSQTALLQGLRRVADLGRVTVLSALAGTIAGLAAIWAYGGDGLVAFIIAQPLTSIAVALIYTHRLPRPEGAAPDLAAIWAAWRPMVALGAVFMLGGLAGSVTVLAMRAVLANDLGLAAAGLFAACWGITMRYVGFLLNAMSADYYPRLTEVIANKPAANRLMNDQSQIGLALGAPVLLALIGLAPWALTLLYSAEFAEAAAVLQWQTLGNIIKIATWPMGFAFVAGAQSRIYLCTQLGWNAMFLAFFFLALPSLGLLAAGVAFFASFAIQHMVVRSLARHYHGFAWDRLTMRLMILHTLLGAVILATAIVQPLAGAGIAVCAAAATGLWGARLVLEKIGPGGRAVTLARRGYARIGWPLEDRHA